jgi:hypothetical protein
MKYSGNMILSEIDLYRAAHLMMHECGSNAELEAARCANHMLMRGDRDQVLLWFAISKTIAMMRYRAFTTGLPN